MCLGNECFALPTLDEFLLDQVEIFIKFGFVLHACMHFFYHLLASYYNIDGTNESPIIDDELLGIKYNNICKK